MKNTNLKAYIIYQDDSIQEFTYPNNMDFCDIAWGILTANILHKHCLKIRNVVSRKEYIGKVSLGRSDSQYIDKYLENKKQGK